MEGEREDKDVQEGKYTTELHRLESWHENSSHCIGVIKGELCVRAGSRNHDWQKGRPRVKKFKNFWIPPEMRDGQRYCVSLWITFSLGGSVMAVGYPIYDSMCSDTLDVVWVAGTPPENQPKPVPVYTYARYIPPPDKCTLTLLVVEKDGEKLFALPDGWFADAIPALDEFENHRYLSSVPGTQNRWEYPLRHLSVIRGGEVIQAGMVISTGGMGAYTIFLLDGFTEGAYPKYLSAARFEVGDKVRIVFSYFGRFPVVQKFFCWTSVAQMSHDAFEIGKEYSMEEFSKLFLQAEKKSAEHLSSEVGRTRIIRFIRK